MGLTLDAACYLAAAIAQVIGAMGATAVVMPLRAEPLNGGQFPAAPMRTHLYPGRSQGIEEDECYDADALHGCKGNRWLCGKVL